MAEVYYGKGDLGAGVYDWQCVLFAAILQDEIAAVFSREEFSVQRSIIIRFDQSHHDPVLYLWTSALESTRERHDSHRVLSRRSIHSTA